MYGWRGCWAGEDIGLVYLLGLVGCQDGEDVRLERMAGCGRYLVGIQLYLLKIEDDLNF